ncbi:restriction endonuclease subunit S [Neptunicella sp. SCSIO 80796]|uniref:restriction endonuclease subunit S n=1 Tax=Neptunicella plasticusilytica TaxID=3117012 RepID=UPI003A4E24E2
MKLGDIVSIGSGRTFRTAVKEDVSSPYKVLQLSNVDYEGFPTGIDWEGLLNVEIKGAKGVATLQSGQIILVAKGSKKPAIYLDDISDSVIATQHFLIINAKPNVEVDTRFIWAYINSEYAQQWMISNSGGSYQSSLSIKVLSELPVPKISLERQQMIVDCYLAVQRELELYSALTKSRTNELNNVFSELTKEQSL